MESSQKLIELFREEHIQPMRINMIVQSKDRATKISLKENNLKINVFTSTILPFYMTLESKMV